MSADAITVELGEEQLVSLASERAGYEARIAAVKDGHADSLDVDVLAARVKEVAAEEARVSALVGREKKKRKKDDEAE